MADLSVIIPACNEYPDILSTLDSVARELEGISSEIIVIDNNSQDGTSEMIESEFPDIVLLKNKENRGVAPARNQGMAIAKGKYVLILDADVELIENTVLRLYEFMESNTDCGVVGSKLVSTDRQLQFTCKRFPNLLSFIFRRLEHFDVIKDSKTLRYHTMRDWDHKEIKEVDYLIGACQFIRSDVIKKIGMYDDKIFYGPEDIDFCLRIWKADWKVIYFPHTQIVHHEQRITKKNIFSSISLKHFIGILYIYRKYNFKISK